MEKESKSRANEIDSVLLSLSNARNRLTRMLESKNFRDPIEIWEVYCDVEQAIAASKFAYGSSVRSGKIRALVASIKNDPATIPLNELIIRYNLVDTAIASALAEYSNENGESAIEFARKARDQLKILLAGRKKAEILNRPK